MLLLRTDVYFPDALFTTQQVPTAEWLRNTRGPHRRNASDSQAFGFSESRSAEERSPPEAMNYSTWERRCKGVEPAPGPGTKDCRKHGDELKKRGPCRSICPSQGQSVSRLSSGISGPEGEREVRIHDESFVRSLALFRARSILVVSCCSASS